MEDTDYALGRTSAEYDRLIEQAELLRPITERVLRVAGICAGMRVLDIGCGVGDVSFLASSLVGSQGCVVGVDLDRDAIQIAENGARSCGLPTSPSAKEMLDRLQPSGSLMPRWAALRCAAGSRLPSLGAHRP